MKNPGVWVGFLCSRRMNAVSHATLALNSELYPSHQRGELSI